MQRPDLAPLPFARGLLLLLSFLWGGGGALALPEDSEQPIEIESDTAEYRDLEGLTIYQGNVRLIQGSLEVEADRIALYSSDNRLLRLLAEGNPARYSQLITLDGEVVTAESRQIEYRLEEGLLSLTGNARLTQQGTTLSGSQILYDVERHVLQASSATDSADGTPERVRVTIPPILRQPQGGSSQ